MFSVPDIALIGVLALLLFGPDKLPGIVRQAGKFMRDVQNTSQSFVAEMERAADVTDVAKATTALPKAPEMPIESAEPETIEHEPIEPEPAEATEPEDIKGEPTQA